jgi:tRNA-dihydrouridine synthase A
MTDPPVCPSTVDPASWRLCVAPMMDWTDRHCRYFHRLLAPHARLYSEMVHAHAVLRGDRERLLGFDPAEHPVALQLGGSEPDLLAEAARIGAAFGYDEINLNVGCPSDRVQAGRFGACLMREPGLVAECIAAMREAVPSAVPVTVKCRIGVDDQDEDEAFLGFVDRVAAAGCKVFIVHARKAWLKGLSPKENREIPPLNHPRVHRLKRERPGLVVVANGGLASVAAVRDSLARVDGVMIGRAAYHEPWLLAELEAAIFGTEPPSREAVLARLKPYVERVLAGGGRLNHVVRHIMGLWQGCHGARAFRRALTEGAQRPGADWRVVEAALAAMRHGLPEAA